MTAARPTSAPPIGAAAHSLPVRRVAACVCFATLLVAAAVSTAAVAAPLPRMRSGAIGAAPPRAAAAAPQRVLAGAVLYDNTGNPSNTYYAGQGGHEAIDDLHLIAGGSLDSLTFEYFDPATGGTFSAQVTIYGNPGGLDLDASPVLGTYPVAGLSRGRHIVAILLPDAPVTSADVWVGVRFSSATAGLIVQSVPPVGTSHDYYLEDGNLYGFGGDPKANFALRLVDEGNFRLDITIVGRGSVTRSPDRPTYVAGTPVQLTAVPDPNATFAGWSGDASGTDNPLSIVMNANLSITATFTTPSFTLRYRAGGGGSISGDALQTVAYGEDGTPVTAMPDAGHHFVSWSDGVLTAARTDVNVTADLDVTASFALNSYTLTVTVVGSGSVMKSPDQPAYDHGTPVTLTATPAPGYHFVGWGGDASGATNPLGLTMISNTSITATFARDVALLALADFEAGLAGWEGYNGGVLTLTSPGHGPSSFAAKLTGPNGTGEFGINDSPRFVENLGPAGTRYRVSAWVRSDAGHGTARIRVREYDPNDVNQQRVYSAAKTLSPAWQQLELEIVTLVTNSWFDIQVLDQPAAAGEMFLVDDIAVERVSSPVAAVSEGDLEYARPVAFPNPARGSAMLALSLAKPGRLRVELFDVAGRRVLAHESEAAVAGTHRFVLGSEHSGRLDAGLYFYRADLGGAVYHGRVVILD